MNTVASLAKTLQDEARDLEELLDLYLSDREFLHAHPDHHLIYFVDSHDLKAFIDPRKLDDPLRDFIFAMERGPLRGGERARLLLELKLKNDQIVGDLLLDPGSRQAGLLPAHAEELEDELSYWHGRDIKEMEGLLKQAQAELKKLQGPEIRRAAALAADGLRDPARLPSLLTFLRRSAPALLALLRKNPDRPQDRIEALMKRSWLDLPADIQWGDFGLSAQECARLQEFVPPPMLVEAWRKYLINSRTSSHWRSNRRDGEAIAWVQALSDELDKISTPKVRALLVTSAKAMRSLAAKPPPDAETAGLKPNTRLRHPRFAVLNSSVVPLQQGRAASDNAEQVLKVALDTYRQQISLLQSQPEAEALWAEQAIDALVNAIHDFEQARFALGLRNDTMNPQAAENLDDETIRQLLSWFASEATMVEEIKAELFVSIQRFGEAVVRLRSGSEDLIFARVWTPPVAPGITYCMPLTGPVIGPLIFPKAHEMSSGDEVAPLMAQLKRLSESKPGRAAWSYLGWALLRACEGNFAAARIYIESARAIAGLFGPAEAMLLKAEANLQLAQIERLCLAVLEPGEEHAARYAHFVRRLDGPNLVADARAPLERAALRLELSLFQPGRLQGNGWPAFAGDIGAALSKAADDPLMTAVILAIGLAGALSCVIHRRENWDVGEPEFHTPRGWHHRLHEIIASLPPAAEGAGHIRLPLAVRAMVVMGFQIAWKPLPAALGDVPLPALRIPMEFRPEPAEIKALWDQERMVLAGEGTPGGDLISQLIHGLLNKLVGALQYHLRRDLIDAPIWGPYVAEEIVRLLPPGEAQRTVRDAYTILEKIAGATQLYSVFERDRSDLMTIRGLLLRALELVPSDSDAEDVGSGIHYFLETERCYIDLLLIRLAEKSRRPAMLAALARDYEAIAERYPQASIPHFRLDVIYSRMAGHERRAMEHLDMALQRAGSDPYKIRPDHWVHSTLRRRRHIKLVRAAEARRAEDPAAYIAALTEAVSSELARHRKAEPSEDYLTKLESERRLNNIVFHASKLLESDASGGALRKAGLEQEELGKLLFELNPRGVETEMVRDIIHTIGFAYHVLGKHEEVVNAAKHFEQLVTHAGTAEEKENDDRKMLEDLRGWAAAPLATWIPGLEASTKGFSESQIGTRYEI